MRAPKYSGRYIEVDRNARRVRTQSGRYVYGCRILMALGEPSESGWLPVNIGYGRDAIKATRVTLTSPE